MKVQNMNETIEIKCGACSHLFNYPTPKVETINGITSSAITNFHGGSARCPSCRQGLIVVIAGAQVMWGTQQVSEQVMAQIEGSKVIPVLAMPSTLNSKKS